MTGEQKPKDITTKKQNDGKQMLTTGDTMEKYGLLSAIAGTNVCNARCPFCIAKMTPAQGMTNNKAETNWRNFHIAARLAEKGGAVNTMITGKGEPTLYPEQISAYLKKLQQHDLPLVDLNTNGLLFMEQPERFDTYLREWYDQGLTTIAISIAHYDKERNREIYSPHKKEYMNLPSLIDRLHDSKYSVRLSCTMLKDYIDSPLELQQLIKFARSNKVEQLTIRPVAMPEHGADETTTKYTEAHLLSVNQRQSIEDYLDKEGTPIRTTAYGARIYDVHGQNVCLTNCLTVPLNDDVRQIIFFPDGHIRYDWQREGAVIL